jgi:hypothetical protein
MNLKENPDLSRMIHNLDISWSDADADTGDHERANELLGALPYLRELCIKADWDKVPFQPRFLPVNALTELRIISIFDSQLRIDNMQRCMALDHVQEMTVWCRFFGAPLPLHGLEKRNSQLVSLDLDPKHHTPPDLLLEILKNCPRIRKLRCALPGLGVMESQNTYAALLDTKSYWTRIMAAPVLPGGISNVLACAKDSLQDLEFRVCPCKWPSQGDLRMDLSMMMSLRSIKCPAECLFVPGSPYSTSIFAIGS